MDHIFIWLGMQDSNLRMQSQSLCLTDLANPQYNMVSAQGFEPRTHALEGRCSIQLELCTQLYY